MALGLAMITVAPCAAAQEIAGSFDQLRVLVKPGDRIRVTDTGGRETLGTIADLGSSSLTLIGANGRRDLSQNDIDTIRQRRSDSVANGAKWGFVVGLGLGALAGAALASGDGNPAAFMVPLVALAYGGLSVGVGVGIDAMISSEQVIYARRSSAIGLSLRF